MTPKLADRASARSVPRNSLTRSHQSIHTGNPVQLRCDHQLDDLLIDLSGALVSTRPDRLNRVLMDALRRLVETLDADHGIFGFFNRSQLVVTHSYARPGFPVGPASVMTHQFPWLLTQLGRGAVVRFSQLDDLPSGASVEHGYCRRHGIRSCAILPLGPHGPSRFVVGVG